MFVHNNFRTEAQWFMMTAAYGCVSRNLKSERNLIYWGVSSRTNLCTHFYAGRFWPDLLRTARILPGNVVICLGTNINIYFPSFRTSNEPDETSRYIKYLSAQMMARMRVDDKKTHARHMYSAWWWLVCCIIFTINSSLP